MSELQRGNLTLSGSEDAQDTYVRKFKSGLKQFKTRNEPKNRERFERTHSFKF